MTDGVNIVKADGILEVTLDRPKVLNALNHLSMTELEQVFLDIRQNASIRAVLLTGAGEKAFIGHHKNWMS